MRHVQRVQTGRMDILAIIAPGILSLLGGWFGARFAIGQYKGERAFDRRVEWYERVLTAITETQWIASSTLHYDERNRTEEAKATWARLGEQIPAVVATFAQRELYAKAAGIAAVDRAELEINKLGDLSHTLGKMGISGVRRELARELMQMLEGARQVLASELRNELYPEPWLRVQWPLPTGKGRRLKP